MKSIRSILLAGAALSICGSAAVAADYYVNPITPGPVAGAPLAAITLQATTESRLQLNVNERGNTAGKWVKVGQEKVVAKETATTSVTAATSPAPAATTAPVTTSTAPSASNTYASVNALVQANVLKGGDKVFLLGGYHGPLNFNGLQFGSTVTIAQAPGQVAHVDGIQIQNSSNLIIRDLKVWPMSPTTASVAIIRTRATVSDIAFLNLDIRARQDSVNYLQWPLTTWQNNKYSAMSLQGARVLAIGNRATGVYHGISVSGPNSRIEGNIIDGFAADGMRALGDNSVVRNNRVQNCHKIDGNHGDGFQSFSRGTDGKPGTGTVYGLVIENNKILEWASPVSSPIRCKLQGIGMFDGMFQDTVIRNNLVSVSQYHGIAVSGADNLLIQNNTVATPTSATDKWPWIRVGSHKNGTPSSNVMVANNIAHMVNVPPDATRNVVQTNNIIVRNGATEFTSVKSLDYSLLPTSRAVDAGIAAYATPADIAGVARPKGKAPDVGAYESH